MSTEPKWWHIFHQEVHGGDAWLTAEDSPISPAVAATRAAVGPLAYVASFDHPPSADEFDAALATFRRDRPTEGADRG